jgi:ABC-2 type transport system permease protein
MSVPGQIEGKRYGPGAFGDDVRRFVSLTYTLAATDFKLIYFGSVLGYIWSLMRPLLFFGVLYVVFTKIFKVGSGTPHYSVELLLAIILWTFFLQSTSGCVQCLLAREGLLRKMRFPRLVVPLAVMLTALFQLATNFIPVLIFAVASGVQPRLTWLLLPVIVGLFAMLAVGIGMLLSVLYIRFRDILPIWDVTSQILFYASPIIYPVWYYDKNPKTGEAMAHLHLTLLAKLLMVNPVAALVAEGRRALVAGQQNVNPSASYALGGTGKALIPVAIIAVVFALGVWVFNREAPRISENL